tara:strand:+ start:274 stop:498 length:225 start_codon:yes stop_codon:yes gene_type:complete
MKRYQELNLILETERFDLEWKEVLKKIINDLKKYKVEVAEATLDLVTKDVEILEEEDVGGRWNWYGLEDDEPVH